MPAAKLTPRPVVRSRRVVKKTVNENTLVYVLGAALMVMLGAALAILAHVNSHGTILPPIEFIEFTSMRVHTQGYAIRASLSVQTASSDSGWVRRNEKLVRDVLNNTLADADPKTLRTAQGMHDLETKLASSLNATLPSVHATAVLLTDFILQEQDD